MTAARMVVRVEPGIARLGLWCTACLLPSAVEVPLLVLSTSGVSRVGVARVCRECEGTA